MIWKDINKNIYKEKEFKMKKEIKNLKILKMQKKPSFHVFSFKKLKIKNKD